MKPIRHRRKNWAVTVYHSFAEENNAEYLRLARLTPSQRLAEFEVLQERLWGPGWTRKPMKKTAWSEKVKW